LKVTTETLEGRETRLDIEIGSDELEKEKRAAARRIAHQARIPGFRKGKAPYDVVLRMFGEEVVQEEALETLAPRLYQKALEEADIEPYAQATLEEVTEADPPVLRMRVPLPPLVEVGDCQSIRVEWEEPTVPDDRVEEVLQEIAGKYGSWEEKAEGVGEGDLVNLDIEGQLEDGQSVMSDEGRSLVVRLDSAFPLPGFHQELLGLEKGESKTFSLTYPEDSSNEELAGKPVEFQVAVNEVMERNVPAIDDELAQLEGDYETLDDLRAEIKERLHDQAVAEAEEEYQRQVLDALKEISQVEFPAVMLERELDDMLESQEDRLRAQGLNMETYLTMLKTTPEAYREGLKPAAEERVRVRLLLLGVAEQEELEPEKEEIERFMAGLTLGQDESAGAELVKFLSSPAGLEVALRSLRREKALAWLVRVARGEEEEEAEEPQPEDAEGKAEEAEPESAESLTLSEGENPADEEAQKEE